MGYLNLNQGFIWLRKRKTQPRYMREMCVRFDALRVLFHAMIFGGSLALSSAATSSSAVSHPWENALFRAVSPTSASGAAFRQPINSRVADLGDTKTFGYRLDHVLHLMFTQSNGGLTSDAQIIDSGPVKSKDDLLVVGMLPPLGHSGSGPHFCVQHRLFAIGLWELKPDDSLAEVEMSAAQKTNIGQRGACFALLGVIGRRLQRDSSSAASNRIAYSDSTPRWTPEYVRGVKDGVWRFARYPADTPPSPPPPVRAHSSLKSLTIGGRQYQFLLCFYRVNETREESWTFWDKVAPSLTLAEVESISKASQHGFHVDRAVRSCPSSLGEARAIASSER
jgi:hypothetical protein